MAPNLGSKAQSVASALATEVSKLRGELQYLEDEHSDDLDWDVELDLGDKLSWDDINSIFEDL